MRTAIREMGYGVGAETVRSEFSVEREDHDGEDEPADVAACEGREQATAHMPLLDCLKLAV